MDIDKLTQKSQEAVQSAQAKAVTFGHQQVDGEHLLLVLLEDPSGLVPRVLQKAEVVLESLTHKLADELRRVPRVSGPGAEPGKIFVTQRFQRLMLTAEKEASRLKDEYVSVEHLVIAMIDEGRSS
ncbi:MAG: hypothetical protein MI919_31655, partial [Holophagales bacterium]|nr:hypothetical protein [Holophagales bacterium]